MGKKKSRVRKKVQRDFQFADREAIEEVARHNLLLVAERVVEGIYRNTPVENGHAHTAWQAAVEQIPELEIRTRTSLSDAGVNHRDLSYDKTAYSAGRGYADLTGLNPKIRLENDLDFVNIIERGGVIKPIEPGGRKKHSIKGPGPLFGPRSPAPPQGMIMYRVYGKWRFASQLDYPARHPVRNAIADAKSWYQSKIKVK